jgi:hypothetical protein
MGSTIRYKVQTADFQGNYEIGAERFVQQKYLMWKSGGSSKRKEKLSRKENEKDVYCDLVQRTVIDDGLLRMDGRLRLADELS